MYTMNDVLEYVRDEDVKFIRLTYFDVFGTQKNIAILPSELKKAFEKGIVIDASAVAGFENDVHGDLYLKPDPTTFKLLPWRSVDGSVIFMICDLYYPDGTPFERDTRYMLKKAIKAAREKGILIDVGTEFEFYLFEMDEKGRSTRTPLDEGGFMDVAPDDGGENLRRNICLTLEEMGLRPQASFHQEGPGQNEIDFHSAPALISADDAAIFKWVVKTCAKADGLYADFSPKPIDHAAGNAMHIVLKLTSTKGGNLGDEHQSFVAGILDHMQEMTLFLNPSETSYKRLGKQKAPLYITWSTKNRFQLIRIPSNHLNRIELRSPDCLCNPYLAITLLIYAGLDGIERNLELEAPCDTDFLGFIKEPGHEKLPTSYQKASQLAQNSSFIQEHVPAAILAEYVH
jgi:glutamine synthetase